MALAYPFDLSQLLRKRHRIRAEMQSSELPRTNLRVAIAGGSTTDELVWLLDLFLLDRGFSPRIHQVNFDQYYAVALGGCPELEAFAPQVIVVHVGGANIPARPEVSDLPTVIQLKLDQALSHFLGCVDGLHRRFGSTIILNNFPYPQYRPLGNLDSSYHSGQCNFVLQLNQMLSEAARDRKYLIVQDIHYLAAQLGLDHYFDENRYHQFRIAESFRGSVHIAHNLGRLLAAQFGLSKKLAVLDLDNTLWGGVIGDDGLQGLQLGPDSPVGEAFHSFQNYLKTLNQRGVVLAVASKNSVENALMGLAHPSSQLAKEDFGDIQANWERKDLSILEIARNLSLGADQFVFLDDNPAERDLVRSGCPTVKVPEANNPTDFKRLLDREGYFEPVAVTEEDLARTQMYSTMAIRTQAQQHHLSYEDYLQSLEMVADIQVCTSQALERVYQLINKTNQFNVTALRHTEPEVAAIVNDPSCLCLQGSLSDKFGKHGLVSVVIGRQVGRTLHLTHWLMSCRVLKRGFEDAMLEALAAHCRRRGIESIRGYYRRTEKNKMVESLYSELGFISCTDETGRLLEADSVFQLDLSQSISIRTHHIRSQDVPHHQENSRDTARLAELSKS